MIINIKKILTEEFQKNVAILIVNANGKPKKPLKAHIKRDYEVIDIKSIIETNGYDVNGLKSSGHRIYLGYVQEHRFFVASDCLEYAVRRKMRSTNKDNGNIDKKLYIVGLTEFVRPKDIYRWKKIGLKVEELYEIPQNDSFDNEGNKKSTEKERSVESESTQISDSRVPIKDDSQKLDGFVNAIINGKNLLASMKTKSADYYLGTTESGEDSQNK